MKVRRPLGSTLYEILGNGLALFNKRQILADQAAQSCWIQDALEILANRFVISVTPCCHQNTDTDADGLMLQRTRRGFGDYQFPHYLAMSSIRLAGLILRALLG